MAEKSFVKNAADPKQVKEASQKEKFKRQQEINDFLWALSDARGRRLIWRYLTICGVYRSSHVLGAPDATAFNEGERNIGLQILGDIMDAKPEAYIEMMRDSKRKEEVEREPEKDEKNDN
jgi:hypothetical protein